MPAVAAKKQPAYHHFTLHAAAAVGKLGDGWRSTAPEQVNRVKCSDCPQRGGCLPKGLDDGIDMSLLELIRPSRRKLKIGDSVYTQGDAFDALYAVRLGTFKSMIVTNDGREQVGGFHTSGELVGFDGLAHGHHASGLMALEDGEVCVLPFQTLSEAAVIIPGLQHLLNRLLSAELVKDQRQMMLLGSMNAEERVATLVLDFSRRYAERGFSEKEFHLRMSRAEIGSFLGMRIETVSRAFLLLQQQGFLEVAKRHIRIIDMQGLKHRYQMVH